jgi:WYL domain
MKTSKSKHTKSSELFNRYIWLVDTIYNSGESGLTFEEINNKWLRNSMSDNIDLPLKTFHNHKAAIQEMFDVNITCNKSTYKYFIDNTEDMNRGGVRAWLLNTFAVNNLINESHKLKHRILFEKIPSGQHFLTTIIEAMRDGLNMEMTYQSYGRDTSSTFTFEPYFVKVFKQRWYVIGKSDHVRIHALDRIQHIETTDEKYEMPEDFIPEEFFLHCFGIIHDETISPQKVQLKVNSWQANYLRALPLHHSQKEIEVVDNDIIFQYFIKPTFDFKQELLSLGSEVEILSPASFRKEMAVIARNMNKIYES